jgi:hypothetical protein
MSMVVPSAFLFNQNAAAVRRLLLDEYELLSLRIYPQRSFVELPCVIPVSFLARKRVHETRAAGHTKIIYDSGPSGGRARPRNNRRARIVPMWKKLDGCVFNPALRPNARFLLDQRSETTLSDVGILESGGRLSRTRAVQVPFSFRGIHARAIRPFHVCSRRLTFYPRGQPRFDRPLNRDLLERRKIVFQDLRYMTHAQRLVAAVAESGEYPVSTAAMFVPQDHATADFFEALLNSAFANAWYKVRDVNRSIKLSYLRRLPVVFDRDAWQRIGVLARRCRTIRSYYHRRLSVCTLWEEQNVLMSRFSRQHYWLVQLQAQIDTEVFRLYGLSPSESRAVLELSAVRVF